MFKNLTNMQKWTVFSFLFVPLLSSLISTIHIVDFFKIGNFIWMAYVLAVAFEIGSIASAIALTVLDKISKFAVWSIFIILVFFQLLGNIFFSFEFITKMQMENSEYLNIVSDFLNYFYEFDDPREFKVTLSILIGMPIPLISLAFLKSVIDYIGNILKDNNSQIKNEIQESKILTDIVDDVVDDVVETEETIDDAVEETIDDVVEDVVEETIEDVVETEDVVEDAIEETIEDVVEDVVEETIEDSVEDEVNTLVFDGNEFVEKKTENVNVQYDNSEIEDLLKKKKEIEDEYLNIQKMKKQLNEFYPQVYGKKYDG